MTDSQRWREKDERLLYADRQMVSLTVSWGLPLHTPLHPPPPISVLPVIHCALTSTPSLSSSLSSSCSRSQSLSSFHACLLCWLHVKCQVRSQLTDPLWHVRWCKTSKVMSSLPPRIPASVPRAVCNGKAPACLLRGQQALSGLQRAVRVKSPQQRYLAAIYSHKGQNLYWSHCCTATAGK